VTFHNFSGGPGGGVVPASASPSYIFLLALLYPLYTLTGYDGSAHTSEETLSARRNVPRGLVHKDLKPAHLLVNCAHGQVRLTGFGLASRLPRERQAPARSPTWRPNRPGG
jgi:serine/threonine protein kinase